ncbi:MAG: DUF3472 domain-containing protein [Bacteroidota bacterium]
MNLKKINYANIVFMAIWVLVSSQGCNTDNKMVIPEMTIQIPTQGNSWFFVNPGASNQLVSDFDNSKWAAAGQVVRTFFWIKQAGSVEIGIKVKTNGGLSRLLATFNGSSKELDVSKQEFGTVHIGTFNISTPGYYYLDLQGVNKQDLIYAHVSDVLLGGKAAVAGVHFSNEDYFYWGRRGPSVHFSYEIPEDMADIKWFYNEATVEKGDDVIGSYYMTNGFAEGYLGFQVNSETERRILFSVWSPYSTDNPSDIPEEYRVVLLKQGDDVVINDFGNEGSGGQSFLRYNWLAGNTYSFLLKVEPAGDNKTDYTAYFFAPEIGAWKLIASWRRPFTNTYAKSLYSFLENFDTNTGPLSRKVTFKNQWVCDINEQWHELTSARFTADATARDQARLDYAGGLSGDNKSFMLKNCGFFSDNTVIDSNFKREGNLISPDIDFSILP